MKTYACLFFVLSSLSFGSQAQCFGSDNYKTCYDDSGNSYTVSKYGNTTNVQGYNNDTGSSWNQSSTTIGNSTYTNGTSADGDSWNSTTTVIGDSTYINGTDSDGNTFNSTCNKLGCY